MDFTFSQIGAFKQGFNSMLSFHKNLVFNSGRTSQVTVKYIFNACSVIQKNQQCFTIILCIAKSIPGNNNIKVLGRVSKTVTNFFPVLNNLVPIGKFKAQIFDFFHIQRKPNIVFIVIQQEVYNRIKGGLMIGIANSEKEFYLLHCHLELF